MIISTERGLRIIVHAIEINKAILHKLYIIKHSFQLRLANVELVLRTSQLIGNPMHCSVDSTYCQNEKAIFVIMSNIFLSFLFSQPIAHIDHIVNIYLKKLFTVLIK